MTDEQIGTELARTVHGWVVLTQQEWFRVADEFRPSYVGITLVSVDGALYRVTHRNRADAEWRPFTDWSDAMALADKWRGSGCRSYSFGCGVDGVCCVTCMDIREDDIEQYRSIDKSGPRAVCMAIVKAMGIEVEG